MILFLLLFQGGAGGFGFLLPMILVFGVFYLLLIRPQQRKQRQLQATIAELKAGDKVVTTGGVIGVITAVRDTSFLIRSADKSILEIARSAVAGVDSEENRSEEHTSELQSLAYLVCRLLLEKKNKPEMCTSRTSSHNDS